MKLTSRSKRLEKNTASFIREWQTSLSQNEIIDCLRRPLAKLSREEAKRKITETCVRHGDPPERVEQMMAILLPETEEQVNA